MQMSAFNLWSKTDRLILADYLEEEIRTRPEEVEMLRGDRFCIAWVGHVIGARLFASSVLRSDHIAIYLTAFAHEWISIIRGGMVLTVPKLVVPLEWQDDIVAQVECPGLAALTDMGLVEAAGFSNGLPGPFTRESLAEYVRDRFSKSPGDIPQGHISDMLDRVEASLEERWPLMQED